MKLSPFRVYLLCCVFRIVNVRLIQSQFDPDEFWQSLEPAYCQVFGHCDGLTWEWKRRSLLKSNFTESVDSLYLTILSKLYPFEFFLKNSESSSNFDEWVDSLSPTILSLWFRKPKIISIMFEGPVRSYTSILPTIIFYRVVKFFGLDSIWMISRGPLILNAVLVAAPVDWSIWYMAQYMEGGRENQIWYLYASFTSWFNAYALIRTYSNSLETAILAIALCLVSPELLGNEKKRSTIIPASIAFFLGGICCSIRFTCLVAFIPMGFILSTQQQSRSIVRYLLTVCAIPGIIGIIMTLLLDRLIYGIWTVPFLGNIHFNVILGNGSLYGTHPPHWYLSAGIPALVGLLLPLLVADLFSVSWTYGRRNLWIICICSVVAHSYSEHKEFRFLLPLLPLFSILSGKSIHNLGTKIKWGSRILTLGGIINFAAVLYLGLIHQRGVVSVNREIVKLVQHEPQTYSIHYLMGCHSTPLLSHLHTPPIKFETWHLDCGPDCRSNPEVECQSDKFNRDPGRFMEDTYFHCSNVEEDTCVTDLRPLYPDFLVVRSSDLLAMKSRIVAMEMKEVGRFTNGIIGIQISDQVSLGESSDVFTKVFLIPGFITLSLEEIILYENKNVNPRY